MILMRPGLAWTGALLSIGLLASGWSVVVGGKAQPAPSLTPRSLTGQSIKRELLGDTALSRILNQPFKIDGRFRRASEAPRRCRIMGRPRRSSASASQ
jgi:hypothetical protein